MAIRTRTIHDASIAGGDARIEEYLLSKGVDFVFHPSVGTDQFDAEKSLRNQARLLAPLDQARVEQYSEAMRRGERFPPVIAHGSPSKYVIADGNHRLNAARLAKKPVAMYHIVGDARTIVLITFEANTRHGLPTNEDERIQHALYLLDNGATIPEAAAALSVTKRLVEKASQTRAADQRFVDADLPLMIIEKLSEPVKRRLCMISTDEGFAAAVNLAVEAALTSTDTYGLVAGVNELRSSDKQVAYVQEQRELYADRINATGGGVLKRKMVLGPKARLGLAMSNITNLPSDLEEITSKWVGPEREEAAKRMRTAARRLNEIAKALQA